MRHLYWKIFAWFWLAMIILAVAIAWTATQLEGTPPGQVLQTGRAVAALERFESEVAGSDVKVVTQKLRALESKTSLRIFLVDRAGRDLLGRPLPESIGKMAQTIVTGGARDQATFLVRPLRQVGGTDHALIATLPEAPITFFAIRRDPKAVGLRLGIAIIVSGLVCLWLARYVTRPVSRLRTAAGEVAGGNFNVRVGPNLGGRRDEIAGLARDFDRMTERLESLLSSQQRLLRDVSHELRSPLARLQVALGLARQRSDDRSQPEFDRIELEAERLNMLIGEILTLERLKVEADALRLEPVDLRKLVEEVVSDARFEAEDVNCGVDVDPASETRIVADGALLRRALENVIRNALQNSPPNSQVDVAVMPDRERAHGLTIRVRDRGAGVPADTLAHLFEPFFRVDDARNHAHGGHGLGLAIAERAVQLHGGSIAARNADGGGLIVEIHLPVDATPRRLRPNA